MYKLLKQRMISNQKIKSIFEGKWTIKLHMTTFSMPFFNEFYKKKK